RGGGGMDEAGYNKRRGRRYLLGGPHRRDRGDDNHTRLALHQLSDEGREARVVGFCPAHVEQIVASFEKAVLTHTLFECIDEYRARRCKAAAQNSDHRHRRLLRVRGKRPCGPTADQADELPSPHSITSAASCWNCSGV